MRKMLMLAFLVFQSLVLYLALIPVKNGSIASGPWAHVGAFFGITFLLVLLLKSYNTKYAYLIAMVYAFGFAFLIEYLQIYTGRHYDLVDVGWGLAGAALSSGVSKVMVWMNKRYEIIKFAG